MRSLRLLAVALALTLVAAACSDDGEEGGEAIDENGITTTTRAPSTTTSQPLVTTPTSEPPVELPPTTEPPAEEAAETTTTLAPSVSVGPPPPPSDLRCVGGSRDNELLVEFDALPDPSAILKIRTYLQVDGEPVPHQRRVRCRTDRHDPRRRHPLGRAGSQSPGQRPGEAVRDLVQPTRPGVRLVQRGRPLHRGGSALRHGRRCRAAAHHLHRRLATRKRASRGA